MTRASADYLQIASHDGDAAKCLLAAIEATGSDDSGEEGSAASRSGDDVEEASEDGGQDDTISPAQNTGAGGHPVAAGASRALQDSRLTSIVGQGASVIPVDQNWVLNQPLAIPLSYQVTSDAQGGVATFTLHGAVDFTNADSVNAANSYIRQRRARARRTVGLAPLQPDQRHRTVTLAQRNWIIAEYRNYAAANDNARISVPTLTQRFNAVYQETPPRWGKSMSAYIDREDKIKQLKNSFRRS